MKNMSNKIKNNWFNPYGDYFINLDKWDIITVNGSLITLKNSDTTTEISSDPETIDELLNYLKN